MDNSTILILLGIIFGLCISGLTMFLFRDITIEHFLKNLQVISKPSGASSPELLEKITEASMIYANLLVTNQEVLKFLLDNAPETDFSPTFFTSLKEHIVNIDKEIEILEKNGLISREESQDEDT